MIWNSHAQCIGPLFTIHTAPEFDSWIDRDAFDLPARLVQSLDPAPLIDAHIPECADQLVCGQVRLPEPLCPVQSSRSRSTGSNQNHVTPIGRYHSLQ